MQILLIVFHFHGWCWSYYKYVTLDFKNNFIEKKITGGITKSEEMRSKVEFHNTEPATSILISRGCTVPSSTSFSMYAATSSLMESLLETGPAKKASRVFIEWLIYIHVAWWYEKGTFDACISDRHLLLLAKCVGNTRWSVVFPTISSHFKSSTIYLFNTTYK